MSIRNNALFLTLAVLFAGCSSTPQFQTGPDAEVSYDGLTRLDKTVMDAVWAREDIDLSAYSKIMFEGVGVEYRDVKGPYSGRAGTTSSRPTGDTEFRLDDASKALFEEEIRGAFAEEVAKSDKYEIVENPGRDVLLVRGGLLDVVSRVPPESMGRSTIYIDSVGEATLVLEIRDSMSNAIYARAIDRRAAQRMGQMMESNRVTNRAEVRRLGRRWGELLRNGLEAMLSAD